MDIFNYKDFKLPVDLINKTGGGIETWDRISKGHMAQLKYFNINPDYTYLEIGCGVGRDAIHLIDYISKKGSYIGIDYSFRETVAYNNNHTFGIILNF